MACIPDSDRIRHALVFPIQHMHVHAAEAQVEEGQWRAILLDRLGPLLQSNKINFKIDVLTDYGTDPLQGISGTVVATAERLGAAALVLSGHSKGSVADWLMGSVGDYAAHHSGVPVVVLHGPQFVDA